MYLVGRYPDATERAPVHPIREGVPARERGLNVLATLGGAAQTDPQDDHGDTCPGHPTGWEVSSGLAWERRSPLTASTASPQM